MADRRPLCAGCEETVVVTITPTGSLNLLRDLGKLQRIAIGEVQRRRPGYDTYEITEAMVVSPLEARFRVRAFKPFAT